jgi:hypothetical protein
MARPSLRRGGSGSAFVSAIAASRCASSTNSSLQPASLRPQGLPHQRQLRGF